MRASISLVPIALVAALTTACGATVEVQRFCTTQQGILIPGSPSGADVTSPTFSVSLTNEIPLLRANSTDTDLRMDEVTIIPVAGNPDLSGITLSELRLQPASGAARDLVQYQKNPASPAPTELVLTGDAGNITPFLDSGRADLQFTLSGQPPRASWTADVKTCLHGQSTVSP